MSNPISGFSKLSKAQKIAWLTKTYFNENEQATDVLQRYWNSDNELQKLHDDFIENTISNYYLPMGIAPNFLVNQDLYAIPMVIEESSVVAAASNAAKFWLDKGGFTTQVISTIKNGQVHLNFFGNTADMTAFFGVIKPKLIASISQVETNMKKRGGGLLDIQLIDSTDTLDGFFQLHCTFETLDAMGANFINTCLETFAQTLEREAKTYKAFNTSQTYPEVVMSILSNYTPECLVRASVSCHVDLLAQKDLDGSLFAQKIVRAIAIAKATPRRAVTHNKGIMNGIDAVILATGNDFRAVEAAVHAYACKDGQYSSLTHASVENDIFKMWIELPLALGTVGGLTSLHPLVGFAFDLLQKPNAKKLMQLVAVAGLAQNFAALRSLVTTGIQKGHMKMHLMNILNGVQATDAEKALAATHFTSHQVSHSAVIAFVEQLRA
ncbi:hydroxymethylglutaryl-CoA reductase, degradative [Flavobacteriaceae bacterium]|nr:hydroxymethylglutaryl-CoA reductase, degradative [Flavobacteriaceae bacterium]